MVRRLTVGRRCCAGGRGTSSAGARGGSPSPRPPSPPPARFYREDERRRERRRLPAAAVPRNTTYCTLYFQNVIAQPPEQFTFEKGKLLWKYVTTPPLASNLEHFQFETLCVSNHTACRFAEKTQFFRLLLARRRCAAASRFSSFKVEILYIKNDKARKMSRHFPGSFHTGNHTKKKQEISIRLSGQPAQVTGGRSSGERVSSPGTSHQPQ